MEQINIIENPKGTFFCDIDISKDEWLSLLKMCISISANTSVLGTNQLAIVSSISLNYWHHYVR